MADASKSRSVVVAMWWEIVQEIKRREEGKSDG